MTESFRVGLVGRGDAGNSDPHETNEAVRFCRVRGEEKDVDISLWSGAT